MCREAAIILLKEKGSRYSLVREPLLLDRCVVCWEADWDDCFELTEFNTKESFIFKVSQYYLERLSLLSLEFPPRFSRTRPR